MKPMEMLPFTDMLTSRYVHMMELSAKGADYLTVPLGDGMFLMYRKNWHANHERFLVNAQRQRVYDISDAEGNLLFLSKEDVDFEDISHLKNIDNAQNLKAVWDFEIDFFTDDIALVRWQLYPDGHRLNDSGSDFHDNAETSIFAYIDKFLLLQTQFKDMHLPEQQKRYRKEVKRLRTFFPTAMKRQPFP